MMKIHIVLLNFALLNCSGLKIATDSMTAERTYKRRVQKTLATGEHGIWTDFNAAETNGIGISVTKKKHRKLMENQLNDNEKTVFNSKLLDALLKLTQIRDSSKILRNSAVSSATIEGGRNRELLVKRGNKHIINNDYLLDAKLVLKNITKYEKRFQLANGSPSKKRGPRAFTVEFGYSHGKIKNSNYSPTEGKSRGATFRPKPITSRAFKLPFERDELRQKQRREQNTHEMVTEYSRTLKNIHRIWGTKLSSAELAMLIINVLFSITCIILVVVAYKLRKTIRTDKAKTKRATTIKKTSGKKMKIPTLSLSSTSLILSIKPKFPFCETKAEEVEDFYKVWAKDPHIEGFEPINSTGNPFRTNFSKYQERSRKRAKQWCSIL